TALWDFIQKKRPNDSFLGEEYSPHEGQSGLTWVIDPVDGTNSFMVGRPTFTTLIALCEDGIPKLGIIDQSILKERWIGVDGKPTLFNKRPAKTRTCPDFDNAVFGATTPTMFTNLADYGCAYEIFETTGNKFVWGGDGYMYGLLASGLVDVVFEENLKPHDYSALVPIVKGAGGHISDWRGDPLTLNSPGKVIAVGDPKLWPMVERIIRKSPY
ncbi:MAG: histidinol phosphate phosphatase, partial [Alphaproteobacteria bacterium]|nr:histidinol phosphate phosphatase [Alphaproteobacteria bacterium]